MGKSFGNPAKISNNNIKSCKEFRVFERLNLVKSQKVFISIKLKRKMASTRHQNGTRELTLPIEKNSTNLFTIIF